MHFSLKILLRTLAIVACVLMIAILLKLFLPARTPEFRESADDHAAKSIAIIDRWDVNGIEQSVTIRGRDISNPVLIWLHGDSTSETAILRHFNPELENHFTMVYWDQRYAGQSFSFGNPIPNHLTIDECLSDLDRVVEGVKTKLKVRQVVLVGHSWGSALGLLYSQRHPENVVVYVGVGQVVNTPKNELLTFRFAMSQAKAKHDVDAIATLASLGPPPRSSSVFTPRSLIAKFGGSFHQDIELKELAMITALAPETNWRTLAAFEYGADYIHELIQGEFAQLELDKKVSELKVPVFIAAGRYDHQSESQLAHEFFETLAAPTKEFMWFEQSAHSPHIEEPEKFDRWMIDRVASAVRDSLR